MKYSMVGIILGTSLGLNKAMFLAIYYRLFASTYYKLLKFWIKIHAGPREQFYENIWTKKSLKTVLKYSKDLREIPLLDLKILTSFVNFGKEVDKLTLDRAIFLGSQRKFRKLKVTPSRSI